MSIHYYKLLDMLQRRGMSKNDLREAAGISSVTMAKLSRGDSVTTEVLNRVCAALKVQPGEIMEYIPDDR